jgi:hypothetical protein
VVPDTSRQVPATGTGGVVGALQDSNRTKGSVIGKNEYFI